LIKNRRPILTGSDTHVLSGSSPVDTHGASLTGSAPTDTHGASLGGSLTNSLLDGAKIGFNQVGESISRTLTGETTIESFTVTMDESKNCLFIGFTVVCGAFDQTITLRIRRDNATTGTIIMTRNLFIGGGNEAVQELSEVVADEPTGARTYYWTADTSASTYSIQKGIIFWSQSDQVDTHAANLTGSGGTDSHGASLTGSGGSDTHALGGSNTEATRSIYPIR